MRRVLCATVVCGGLALVGCVGITDPATNVGQMTARLNAHGRTDDTSAHFYFRYANQEADLPTAAAKRTPTRTVPAHRPDNGEFGYFGENVTGLSPGRNYFFELCGGDDKPGAPDWCGGRQRFFTEPSSSQDSVAGEMEAGAIVFIVRFKAASGPQGQNADGWFEFRNPRNGAGNFDARITCLEVEGSRAAMGLVIPGSDGSTSGLIVTLTDGGPGGTDTIGSAPDDVPPDCADANFDDQQGAYNSTLVVRDVP
jgi:hypothetical protein